MTRNEILTKLRAERRRTGRSLRGLYRLTTEQALAELQMRTRTDTPLPPTPPRRDWDAPTFTQLHDLAVWARRHSETVPENLTRAQASALLADWKARPTPSPKT